MNPIFEKLTPWLDKAYALNSALVLFEWDNETEAPEDASELTARAIETLSNEYYETIINADVKKLLKQLSSETDLDAKEKAIVKDLQKQYDSMEPIPQKEYKAYQGLTARASSIWSRAKAADDYSQFAPTLKEIINYQKKFIDYRLKAGKSKMKPYDLLLNDYEEGFTMKELDDFFETLKKDILPIIHMVTEKKDKINKDYNYRLYPVALQKDFNRMLAEHVGFNFKRGVMKESVHPFTTNLHNRDVRITTAYDEHNLESAIFSTIHESGHALYEMHIADDLTGTPAGCGTSMGMHEGQSRLFENNLGRSTAFWVPLFQKLKDTYPDSLSDIDLDHFILGINKSSPSLIRTESDELTYSLHIMVRYEVEKMIFEENADIDKLSEIWNKKYEEYLGVTPEKDSKGILQDIHWAGGSFGYFPSYALGNAIAAQIYAHLKEAMPLDDYLEKGNFQPVNDYLKEHIHRFGKTKTTNEILNDMTGESFNPKYYTEYLKDKYETLYKNL
ncbi:MAG: carboxypeptidase M32 [Clostridia bacterium]|nr:carboxypeptidase M32 [Clostridia bacterium]NCD02068.1 carboxypeptidase M32 [Clostridia bacterium]